jgi:DNA polymerase III epsilon subunit-like protein
MKSTIQCKNILVFDTETTGLIKNKNSPLSEYPYIIQFSFMVYDVQNEIIRSSYNAYIKIPSSIIIPEVVTKINGINNEKCEKEGISITEALGIFYHAVNICDCVIGHNIDFDIQMVNAEIIRNLKHLTLFPDIIDLFDINRLASKCIQIDCTMKMTIGMCNLIRSTEKNHKYKKFPKLTETYFHLFNEHPENLHNSIIDTLICLRCYLKIKFDIHISNHQFIELIQNYL